MCFRTARGAEIDHLRIGVDSRVSGYLLLVRGEIFLLLCVLDEITARFDVSGNEIFKCFEENLSWRKQR